MQISSLLKTPCAYFPHFVELTTNSSSFPRGKTIGQAADLLDVLQLLVGPVQLGRQVSLLVLEPLPGCHVVCHNYRHERMSLS